MERVEGGYRVAENDTHHFEVHRMMFNWRVCLVPKDAPMSIDRGFCYTGVDDIALLTACAAAVVWAHDGTEEPPGWNKNVQTGEWRPDAEYS